MTKNKQNLDRFRHQWWNPVPGVMMEVVHFSVDDDYALVSYGDAGNDATDEEVRLSDGTLRQSTGLRDKNGKLIYEGDIIISQYDTVYQIQWDQAVPAFRLFSENDDLMFHQYLADVCKIIGNIYKNPELVEK